MEIKKPSVSQMTDSYESRRDKAAEAELVSIGAFTYNAHQSWNADDLRKRFISGADWGYEKAVKLLVDTLKAADDKVERLERELASEVSRHVETDKSYKHWRDKANHLTAERDALKAQAESLAKAAFAVCSSEEVDSANEVFGERLDKLSEALAAYEAMKSR